MDLDTSHIDFLLETDAELHALAVAEDLCALAEEERPKYITNYIGSKQKLVEWIWQSTPDGVTSAFDAFSGSSVVGYLYKSKGLRVVANDKLRYAWHVARALVENSGTRLTDADIEIEADTEFTGYEHLQDEGQVLAIVREGQVAVSISAGECGGIVLDCTPLYAESGGQVGDHGVIHGSQGVFRVEDTHKNGDAFVHVGVCESGTMKIGDKARAEVDVAARSATALNHSATHLMHAALKQVIVWTINDGDEMRTLLDVGVDGIITDRPDILRDVMQERAVGGPWNEVGRRG